MPGTTGPVYRPPADMDAVAEAGAWGSRRSQFTRHVAVPPVVPFVAVTKMAGRVRRRPAKIIPVVVPQAAHWTHFLLDSLIRACPKTDKSYTDQ